MVAVAGLSEPERSVRELYWMVAVREPVEGLKANLPPRMNWPGENEKASLLSMPRVTVPVEKRKEGCSMKRSAESHGTTGSVFPGLGWRTSARATGAVPRREAPPVQSASGEGFLKAQAPSGAFPLAKRKRGRKGPESSETRALDPESLVPSGRVAARRAVPAGARAAEPMVVP